MSYQMVSKRLILIASIVLLIIFRRYVITGLLPFFIAFILAGLIEPLVDFFHTKIRLPRSAAVASVLIVVIVFGGYATTLMSAKVLAELVDMSEQAGAYQKRLLDLSNEIVFRFTQSTDEDLMPPQVQNAIRLAIQNLSERGEVMAVNTINSILNAFVALPGLLAVIIITVIATYFISKDRAIISASLLRFAPARWREPLAQAQDRIVTEMAGFLKAQFFLLAITTTIAALGLYALGNRYWLTLALLTGILDVIPVVGPGFLFTPWAGANLLLGDAQLAVQLLLIYFALFIVRQLLQPRILGSSIGAHPLLMLAAVYIGIVAFGIHGFIVGPVIVIITRALATAGLFPRLLHTEDDESMADA